MQFFKQISIQTGTTLIKKFSGTHKVRLQDPWTTGLDLTGPNQLRTELEQTALFEADFDSDKYNIDKKVVWDP